jgi:diguanylate cyclase (GGDEF)-like protein
MEAALRSPEGWEDGLLDDGVPVLLVHKRLREADWTIGLSYPVRSAFSAAAGRGHGDRGGGPVRLAHHQSLLRPLHRHVEDISAGRANISVFDVVRKDEFGHLSRAFYGLSQRREQAELELHRLATTDVLTGLNNRRMFDAFLPQALARAARSGQTVGLAILDIDHFKTINDTLGHPAGDQVLIEFSRRLTGAVRTTDTVARLAGDEFVIVFEQLSTAPEMTLLGEKILDAMRPPFTLGTLQREVGTSIGIAVTAPMCSPRRKN